MVIVPLLIILLSVGIACSRPVVFKETGSCTHQQSGSSQSTMREEYAAAFYADSQVITLPYADYDATCDFAKLMKAKLLVISEEYIR